MTHVVVIGCGVIGAAVAYELSLLPDINITVLDKQPPAQAATGAALGVCMGVSSHKIKGSAWHRRLTSIQRYDTLIPELEAITQRKIPFNRQGILSLCFPGQDLAKWQHLAEIRHSQGCQLEIWDAAKVKLSCPQLASEKLIGAVYSPQDRQVDPTALTLALVDAAQHNGVEFKFGVSVLGGKNAHPTSCTSVETTDGEVTADWFVVAAGLGSSLLTAQLNQMVDIRPVLGQALHLRLGYILGNPDFQPAIAGNDVYIVPCGGGDYWIGATVEFPKGDEIVPDKDSLETLRQSAIAFCSELATATVVKTWSGLRPRPENRPAPVIGFLPGYSNVLLATGHYRNGVLLAPSSAAAIRQIILE